MTVDYSLIPGHCQDGMRQYIEAGRPTGSFLRAVLENDLIESFRCADDINVCRIRDYLVFMHNYAPAMCYGSPEKVEAWINAGGMKGIRERAHQVRGRDND